MKQSREWLQHFTPVSESFLNRRSFAPGAIWLVTNVVSSRLVQNLPFATSIKKMHMNPYAPKSAQLLPIRNIRDIVHHPRSLDGRFWRGREIHRLLR